MKKIITVAVLLLTSGLAMSGGVSWLETYKQAQQINNAMEADKERSRQLEREAEAKQKQEEKEREAEKLKALEAQARAGEEKARRKLAEVQAEEAKLRQIPEYRTDYAGQACYFFNRPTVEATPQGDRENIHAEEAWVCHQDAMYQCRDGKWKNRGACSQWGTLKARLTLQSHTLEGVAAVVVNRPSTAALGVTNASLQSPTSSGSDNPFK